MDGAALDGFSNNAPPDTCPTHPLHTQDMPKTPACELEAGCVKACVKPPLPGNRSSGSYRAWRACEAVYEEPLGR